MADDEQYAEQLEKENENRQKNIQTMQRQVDLLKSLDAANSDVYAIETKMAAQLKEKYKEERKIIAEQMRLNKGVNEAQMKKLKAQSKEVTKLQELEKASSASQAAIERMTRVTRASSQARKDEIKEMEAAGKKMRANWEKWKDSFKDDDGTVNKGTVAKAILNPIDAISQANPIVGMMIKFIVDTIDSVRKLKGEMMEASAASGQFGKSANMAAIEAQSLAQSQMEFTLQGLDVEKVAGIYKELKNTGLAAMGIIPRIPGELSKAAKASIMFAKASGESTQEVAERFASLQRNFGVSQKNYVNEYNRILGSAQEAAEDGITTTAGYMQTVMSLGMAFTDTGASIAGVNSIVQGVGKTMKELGRPMANLQKVAQGIMGITKASEGWQVFMGRMSGMQGGYAQTLFKMQQRGPGGQLAKAGEMDPTKYVAAAKNMLLKPTAGISDQATRQLMIERLGSQLGMDSETTQIFQKMSAGKMSTSQAGADMKKLWEEAKESNMSQKGMFDIIKNILMGLIAKPILWIYEILQKWFGSIDEGAADVRIKELSGMESNDVARGPVPRYVTNAGMMRVHADEIVGGKRAIENAKTQPYNQGNTSTGGNNFSFNMQIDANSLTRSFEEMKRLTYGALMNQQTKNYVG